MAATALARACNLLGSKGPLLPPLVSAFSSVPGDSSTSTSTSTSGSNETSTSTSTSSDPHSDEARKRLLSRLLRGSHAAEVAAQAFFKGQQLASGGHRADVSYFKDQEGKALDQARALLPKFRARPSLLQGVLRLGGVATGVAAGLAPRPVQLAIWGAVSEAMEEHYTDTLRDLLEAAAEHKIDPQQVPELREALRQLRDVERAPEGAPPAPDIMILQKLEKVKEIGVSGVAALAVKLAGKAALGAATRL